MNGVVQSKASKDLDMPSIMTEGGRADQSAPRVTVKRESLDRLFRILAIERAFGEQRQHQVAQILGLALADAVDVAQLFDRRRLRAAPSRAASCRGR